MKHQLFGLLIVLIGHTIAADIGLALGLPLVLPYHWNRFGWFSASNQMVAYEKAIYMSSCPCKEDVYDPTPPKHVQYQKPKPGSDEVKPGSIMPRNMPTIKPPEITTTPKDKLEQHLGEFPFLLALLQQNKNSGELWGVCTAITLDETTALVDDGCCSDMNSCATMTLRGGSPYWTKAEHEYQILASKSVRFYKNFYIRLFTRYGDFRPQTLTGPKFKFEEEDFNPMSDTWNYAISVGWKKNSTQYEYTLWEKDPNAGEFCKTYSEETYFEPVFTSCREIITMKYDEQSLCSQYNVKKVEKVGGIPDRFKDTSNCSK